MNLLQYIVKQYLKQYERSKEKGKSDTRFLCSASLSNAAQVQKYFFSSFNQLETKPHCILGFLLISEMVVVMMVVKMMVVVMVVMMVVVMMVVVVGWW